WIARASVVLPMTAQPLAYIIPFLPPGVRVIAPASNFTNPRFDNRLQRDMETLIATHRGPLYALRYLGAVDAGDAAAMAAYGLRREDEGCRPIPSNPHTHR